MRRLLVANRGEIARRIMRTARRMGISTVAVYSDADRDALHVREADQALRIGEAAPRRSYLSIEAIIAAAREAGADAVHPGYGFLSENAAFARACRDAGLVFVGPSPEAIAAMGDKAAAKARVAAAGVPVVPGFTLGADAAAGRVRELGLPVILKAAAGGGGRGMRVVREAAALPAALASARSEAESAFGSGALLAERLVEGARHIEVQIVADAHGAVLHLGERDCSAQRRHQKVIEEAPSPAVDAELRARLGALAVAAACAVDYRGVGTVELLLGANGELYFIEMNTRLQVEHAVTELVYGVDLVEWQLRVARGEPLGVTQEALTPRGHAIEARLYAEDPSRGFAPCTGTVLAWRRPPRTLSRVEHALEVGQEIASHYDPMLAKLVTHGRTREEARLRLLAALRELVLLGVGHNGDWLQGLLEAPPMRDGSMTTDALERLAIAAPPPPDAAWALAALVRLHLESGAARPWSTSGALAAPVVLRCGEETRRIEVEEGVVHLGDRRLALEAARVEASPGAATDARATPAASRAGHVSARIGGARVRGRFAWDGAELWLHVAGTTHVFSDETRRSRGRARPEAEAARQLVAPMSARIVSVSARVGAEVVAGQVVVVLEAMKMEHALTVPVSGRVAAIAAQPGGQARRGQVLLELE